jgi:hypothetical protein
MLVGFPLLLIPFAFFNMAVFLLNMPFTDTVFSIPLGPDREMPVDLGDLIVASGILRIRANLTRPVTTSTLSVAKATTNRDVVVTKRRRRSNLSRSWELVISEGAVVL